MDWDKLKNGTCRSCGQRSQEIIKDLNVCLDCADKANRRRTLRHAPILDSARKLKTSYRICDTHKKLITEKYN